MKNAKQPASSIWKKRQLIRKAPILVAVVTFAIIGSMLAYHSFAANSNLPGDLNNDNTVNLLDLSMLLSAWNKADSSVDLNGDNKITLSDLSILLTNWNKHVSTTPPTPPVPPTPPAPSTGLPAKIVAGYYAEWDGSTPATIMSKAPGYNLLYAAFAWTDGGTDKVVFGPSKMSATQLKAEIAASKAMGTVWILSMGGGGDKSIRLLNETNATNIYNSLVPIIDNYGFQGLDFDIECGSGCWNATAAISLSQKLKTKYGDKFFITAVPRPYEARDSGSPYAQLAAKAGNLLDLYALQFYDFNEANNASQLRSIVLNDLNTVTGQGVPASKILIGAITYDGYSAGHNTDETYASIYNEAQQQHPGLRGAFVWDTGMDEKNNWQFPVVVGGVVRD